MLKVLLSSKKKYACLLLLIWISVTGYSQQASSFISISDELVNNEVTSIIQDKNGFIWFGTRGGMQRFDGYEMKLLKNDFGKGANLLSQSIEVLQSGKQNNIWIGTKSGGLSSYNLESGTISNHINHNTNETGFNADYILSILDTDSEKLLIGTWKGFQYLDKRTGEFKILNSIWKTFDIQSDGNTGYWLATNSGLKHLNQSLENDYSFDLGIPNINITSIVIDKANNCLWLGSWDNGLFQFNTQTKAVKNFRHQKNNKNSLSSNNTYRILLDSKGILWVGTWGGGLNRFDPKTESFERINLNIKGLYTSDSRIILTIKEDPSGLLWIGTDGTGVFKFDLNQKQFNNIGYENPTASILESTHVLSVFVDPFNKLWLGTKGGGIQYSTDWKTFNRINVINKEITNAPAIPYESRSFMQDGDYLWVATNKGLIRIVNKGADVSNYDIYFPTPQKATSFSGKKITAMVKDSSGRMWIGTQESGLSYISGFDDRNTPVFKNYLPAYGVKGALQNERVSCLLVDSKKRLWVGTYKGLHLYQPSKDQFQVFTQTDNYKNSLSNNTILCLAEDKFGNIWAGTQNGLNRISGLADDHLIVTAFTTRDGLPSDYIHAIIPDTAGRIWASTNKGIIRFNQSNNSLEVFDKRDGVQSVVFSENAAFKDAAGRFYFGGLEGMTYFFPDSIRINRFNPPIYFTNLTVNNRPYEYGTESADDSSILNQPFYETESITLNYKENIFSIEFSALDYHAPDKNEYMYKLEGFNKDWVYAGKSRMASFTNLKPGTYKLQVKATNSDKIWNPVPHELTINILPPPWRTWWAYSIYFALFVFLLWLTRHLGLRQVALKNQLSLSKLERQQESKLADFKERLFTNISHEFRTPLTLILGPLDDMLQTKKVEAPVEKSLRLIQKQSRRMLRMVNQLLDFQKAEAGSLKLSLQPGELVSFCEDIFMLFMDEAKRRQIDYTFQVKEKFLSFTFDHNKLEIIVFNILSNAFKFTPDGGKIILSIRKNMDQSCEINVQDTGRGIPANEIDQIFDRFFRGKEMDATAISGTGIGLSFVKELVELHGGFIVAKSDGINGSLFTINLPSLEQNSPNGSPPYEAIHFTHPNNETIVNPENMSEENSELNPEQDQPIILIVEDDSDIQQYIFEILSPSFKVLTAMNGKEGVEKALEAIPDLIVSDIMMPEMDGIELCRTLKFNKNTSHIPIILLTALSDMAHHVQGIREGADVYLPKPFNSQLLLVHIHNLINSRNMLKELYAKKILLGSGNFEIKTFEEEFLYKLIKLVEENISNSEFNNDELANLMFMSRSTFYRKLKAVTGMSGNEFIRNTRLNYAVKLLESGNYSVTEAAYEAGFNDIKYFRKRFQEQFGVSPSDYKK